MPADNSIIDYGEDRLKQLLIHFQGHLTINTNRAFTHYLDLKLLIRQQKTLSLQQIGTHILDHYSEELPDFRILYQLLLIAPVISVASERGFSCQNRMKTKLRSRLLLETVTKLIRVQQDGSAFTINQDPLSTSPFKEEEKKVK